MHFATKLLVLYWASCSRLTTAVEVSYEELQQLNATCHPLDTCKEPRVDHSPGISSGSSCSCSRYCSYFDTCCLDSSYDHVKAPVLRPSCRTLKMSSWEQSYFMIDRCPSNVSAWDTLCNDEWDGENDVMRLVPVTSVFTSITYKNYFCLRCHEKTNDFYYWNVFLRSNSRQNVQPEVDDANLWYSSDNETWVFTLEKDDVSIAVSLKFEVPDELRSLPINCEPDVISDCSTNWTDDSTRDKCQAYTAIVYIRGDGDVWKYRNAHCALCNFESLDDMFCKTRGSWGSGHGHGGGGGYGHGGKVRFSFTHLLDINRSDGEKVGKVKKCEANLLWDPFAKKCRVLTCALPGYVVKEGKCVPQ